MKSMESAIKWLSMLYLGATNCVGGAAPSARLASWQSVRPPQSNVKHSLHLGHGHPRTLADFLQLPFKEAYLTLSD